MAIVYLEDLLKHVPNKYLAVNVIAKRARSLNDELLGAGFAQNQKPITVATEELSSGELSYQVVVPKVTQEETPTLFATESDGEDHLVELYGEQSKEDSEGDSDNGESEAVDDTETVVESEPDDTEDNNGESETEPTESE